MTTAESQTVTVIHYAPQPEPPPQPTGVRRVRVWGDPIMAAQGLTLHAYSEAKLPSNFQAVGLYNKAQNGFGGVTSFLQIPQADMRKIEGFNPGDAEGTTRQKMNWLANSPEGKIYFANDPPEDYKTAAFVRWGTIALGGNLVSVEGYETIRAKFPDGKIHEESFARLRGFTPSDWGRPIQDLLNAGLLHRCWCAYRTPVMDAKRDTPRGVVYSPFYDPKHWTFIGNNAAQIKNLYIPEAWLEAN